MIIKQKELDETWGWFIDMSTPNNISNINKEKFIQIRDKLQKQIDEKGYADTDDPKLTEWWLKNKTKKPKRIRITELELIFCPKENEIIQFDKKCVECKHFNGHYSAIGYIECDYDGN